MCNEKPGLLHRSISSLSPHGLALAASVALTACGTGSILEQGGDEAGGSVTLGNSAGRVDPPGAVANVVPDGAKDPRRVFSMGHAVAGCDVSVQGYGNTPLRRLTNLEYDNTVRDTFGIDPTPKISADFPRDGEAGPFPSNAKGGITEMYLNRYEQAAERVGKEVAGKVEMMVPCGASGDANCAKSFIAQYGKKAFRRTLADDQIAALMQVYDAGAKDATFREGIQYVVQAMLLSPSFMYHLEVKPKGSAAVPLPPAELAERLSYFIWGSIPDDELFANAEAGKLDTKEGLKAEAMRLMKDPKAQVAMDSFSDHWLHLHQAEIQMLPADKYPDFNADYGRALGNEAKKFVSWIFRSPDSDGTYEQLMTSNLSFPEGPGFAAYKMTPPAGYDGSKPIKVPGNRAGVITQPASMSSHSSEATSPIKRGVFVLNDILCRKIELPANTMIPPLPPPTPGRSIRQGLEEATKQVQCAGCHAKINPIGFALEGYDRMGRERDVDEFNVKVDTKGMLQIGDPTVDGMIDGGLALTQKLVLSDSGRNCMIQQVFRVALSREEDVPDTCSFAAMAQDFEKSGFSVRELFVNMVTQDTFRFHPGS